MKKLKIIGAVFIASLVAFMPLAGKAQSTSVVNLLTNVPASTLANETIGVTVGPLYQSGGTYSAALIGDYDIHTNYFLRGEVDTGSSSSVVNSIGVGGGVSKTWTSVKVYAFGEGRRNFGLSAWQGVVGGGIAYTPSTNTASILGNFSTVAEERLVITKLEPSEETLAGVRYSF
jgi:hypothetical protein